jgi:hypothetical protein
MDFLSLSFAMADKQNDYLPYVLYDGAWTQEEADLIHQWMLFNHPHKVWATYNAWCFGRSQYGGEATYRAKRVSYDNFAWHTNDREKLLHVVALNSGKWTPDLLMSTFPTREITPDEAIALPFTWYADKPDYQREFYTIPRLRLLVELPYVTALFHQYTDELFEQHTVANLPR